MLLETNARIEGKAKPGSIDAGTGKIGLIKNEGWQGFIVCNELEPEFANIS